ncbi:MAG: large conductance mechanosensitive channel protein MscL [Patescibacteria group bacterium]
MFKGFKDFILRGNVVDLAVGVVVGAAFGSVVTALVKDLLTPLIGAVGHVPDFSMLTFTINGSQFMYGEFLNALISFLLVSIAVYFFVVLPMNAALARMRKQQPPPADPAPTKEQSLLMEIRDAIKAKQ